MQGSSSTPTNFEQGQGQAQNLSPAQAHQYQQYQHQAQPPQPQGGVQGGPQSQGLTSSQGGGMPSRPQSSTNPHKKQAPPPKPKPVTSSPLTDSNSGGSYINAQVKREVSGVTSLVKGIGSSADFGDRSADPHFEGSYVGCTPTSFQEHVTVLGRYRGEHMTIEVEQLFAEGYVNRAGWGNMTGQNMLRVTTPLGNSVEDSRGTVENIVVRRLKITLDQGEFCTKQGALAYMKGEIGISGTREKLVQSIKPVYKGTGVVYTEPTRDHFVFIMVDGRVVIDKQLWYLSEEGMNVTITRNTMANAVLSGKGLFQQKLEGKGCAILKVPMPAHEIQRIPMDNERVHVDGSFTILRKGNVELEPTLAGDDTFQMLMNTTGEGLVQAFFGTGEIWVCPTFDLYPQPPERGFDDEVAKAIGGAAKATLEYSVNLSKKMSSKKKLEKSKKAEDHK